MKRAFLICCVVSVICLTILAWRVPTSGLAQDTIIKVNPEILDFGTVGFPESVKKILVVVNTGTSKIKLFANVESLHSSFFESNERIPARNLEVLPGDTVRSIVSSPGEFVVFTVTFAPISVGVQRDKIKITATATDFSAQTIVEVPLIGRSTRSAFENPPAQVCVPVHENTIPSSPIIGVLGLNFSPSPFTPSTSIFIDCRDGSQTAGQFSLEQHAVGPFFTSSLRGGPSLDLDMVQQGSFTAISGKLQAGGVTIKVDEVLPIGSFTGAIFFNGGSSQSLTLPVNLSCKCPE